jgi:hypothetical protein
VTPASLNTESDDSVYQIRYLVLGTTLTTIGSSAISHRPEMAAMGVRAAITFAQPWRQGGARRHMGGVRHGVGTSGHLAADDEI